MPFSLRAAALFCVAWLAACTVVRAGDAGGWRRLTLDIVNEAPSEALACQFLFAHWFETTIAPVAPGGARSVALLIEPGRGAVAVRNEAGAPMLLEQIHCGLEGTPRRDWSRVAVAPLRAASGAVQLACDGRACRFR